jgi:hypothetical protein
METFPMGYEIDRERTMARIVTASFELGHFALKGGSEAERLAAAILLHVMHALEDGPGDEMGQLGDPAARFDAAVRREHVEFRLDP